MANYLVRVVLHSTSDLAHPNYLKLHTAMANAGFSTTIKSFIGATCHLPPAEYALSGNYTVHQLLEIVENIAKPIDSDFGILASETAGANVSWHNLKPA